MSLFKDQKVAYEYRGHKVLTGKAVFPDNKEHEWTTVDFQNSVSILPINAETGKLILIKQYRPALKAWCIEQVAGGIEPELSIMQNAQKEVLEEIGYQVPEEYIYHIHDFYFTPGLMNFKTHFFIALCKNFVGQQLEETELIQVVEMTEPELFKIIAENKELVDPEILVGLSVYRNVFLGQKTWMQEIIKKYGEGEV